MEFSKIGFLGMYRFDKDTAIRGAILITDTEMKPLEFRVTEPICPEDFQKIIYGELLDEHISVELISLPLLKATEEKPDLILVQDNLFLRLNIKQESPTVCVLQEKEDEALASAGTTLNKELNIKNPDYPSINIYTSEKCNPKLDEIRQNLDKIVLTRNLVEPFYRLQKACEDIHSRKLCS